MNFRPDVILEVTSVCNRSCQMLVGRGQQKETMHGRRRKKGKKNGKLSIQKERFDLSALIQEVIERMSLQTVQAISFDGSERLEIFADPVRIEQVLVNLISNAIKYGEEKPIRVKVETADLIKISVIDQGAGVRPEDQEKIFQRFERATKDKNISGFGIGLYISKEIVEAHGGKISVRSLPEGGTEFSFELKS